MLLTSCAVCATELGLTLGKKCGRCSTRYCGVACQKKHWEEGGHDKLCKLIKKASGAEQYNANKKYSEAVAVAAEACAEDTKGQTCYICTQALHWKTKEGLVRMCACRGTAGFAHVSCLAEQAKILYDEAEENNLDLKVKNERWHRWHKCGLCEQEHHGVVYCALSWACWKTYVGRPEADWARRDAMNLLGNSLHGANRHEEALSVYESALSVQMRHNPHHTNINILVVKSNMARIHVQLGRHDNALEIEQEMYEAYKKYKGPSHEMTLGSALNLALTTIKTGDAHKASEAMAFTRQLLPVARGALGADHDLSLRLAHAHGYAVLWMDDPSRDELAFAETLLEDTLQRFRRVFGSGHPSTQNLEADLSKVRGRLACEKAEDGADRELLEHIASKLRI